MSSSVPKHRRDTSKSSTDIRDVFPTTGQYNLNEYKWKKCLNIPW